MISRFRVPPLVISRLKERSISPEAVLRDAGLPVSLIGQDKILLTTEQFFAFWGGVAAVSGDAAIGLALGSEAPVERLDVVSLAALSAANFRDALARAARYKQLTCPEEIQLQVRRGECAIRFRWLLAQGRESPVLTDLCFAWIASLAHRGTAAAVRPTRVEFSRAPRDRSRYEAHFGCPVRFKAPTNTLFFRASDLDRPFVTHNADLLGILAPSLDAELADRNGERDVRSQVRSVLQRLLRGRRPDLQHVARELASSPRTVQRRLRDIGMSFHAVLEEFRLDTARDYLANSSLELAEIGYLLGYEDSNSFVRAFNRWTGAPPGRWREAQRARAVSRRAITRRRTPASLSRRRVSVVS